MGARAHTRCDRAHNCGAPNAPSIPRSGFATGTRARKTYRLQPGPRRVVMSSRYNTGGAVLRVLPLAFGAVLSASSARASALNVNATSKYFGGFGLQVVV